MPQKITLDQSCNYRICIQGRLNGKWADYFESMRIENGSDSGGNQITYLSGPLTDQAALQGVLQKLYNLGFPLILAEKIDEADDNHPAQ